MCSWYREKFKYQSFQSNARSNETRHIRWHETCTCKCRLDASVCINKQLWDEDKCMCECKELIDKGVCNKGFIWNPSYCECECDKSCDIGEYLDYLSCKCRKRLVDKFVEGCIKSIDEEEITGITQGENKYSSCIIYIILFSIIFTINIGIVTYFTYYKYISRNKKNVSECHCTYRAKNY